MRIKISESVFDAVNSDPVFSHLSVERRWETFRKHAGFRGSPSYREWDEPYRAYYVHISTLTELEWLLRLDVNCVLMRELDETYCLGMYPCE